MPDLLPLFVNLAGRPVLLVGGGRVAAGKLQPLLAAGACVRVVAPAIVPEIRNAVRDSVADADRQQAALPMEIVQRGFLPADLDDAWLVVAAATADVNREVAAAAQARHIFVNAVDDPPNASAFLSGVVRRDGVTIAVSTSGDAPALTALVREGLDALLPRELPAWMHTAREERTAWRRDRVPMPERKPLLLRALNDLYRSPEGRGHTDQEGLRLSAQEGLHNDQDVTRSFPAPLAPISGERRRGSPKREQREGGSAIPFIGSEDS